MIGLMIMNTGKKRHSFLCIPSPRRRLKFVKNGNEALLFQHCETTPLYKHNQNWFAWMLFICFSNTTSLSTRGQQLPHNCETGPQSACCFIPMTEGSHLAADTWPLWHRRTFRQWLVSSFTRNVQKLQPTATPVPSCDQTKTKVVWKVKTQC